MLDSLRPILKTDRSLSFYRYITGKLFTDEYGPLFQRVLVDSQCLVIIDGLDEVPDPVLRMRVTEKIEQFVSEYHQNIFIVTSRIVGYRENPLTGDFLHFQLMEWQPEQIIAYLERWYLAVENRKSPETEPACKQRAQDLWKEIEKNEGVKDLAGTQEVGPFFERCNKNETRLQLPRQNSTTA